MSALDKNSTPLQDKEDLEEHIRRAIEAKEPQGRLHDLNYKLIKRIFDPRIVNAENIPDRPCLFVGNHAIYALDGIVLIPMLQEELGRVVHPLADKIWFSSKRLEDSVLKAGGAMAHPEVCSALMRAGRDVLVFPGGAHESLKPASAMYQLQWKERYGFVKLAAKHGYTIMPFGLIGPDEFFNHAMEGQELPNSRAGKLLKRLGILTEDTREDLLPPIPAGLFGTLIPKPQRCYLGFGKPIDLAAEKGKRLSSRRIHAIRQQVADIIEAQLAELLMLRTRLKGEEGLVRKILTM